jgi:hypothetical protein
VRLVLGMLAVALAVTAVVGCTGDDSAGESAPDEPPRPRVMAALGDSITRGFAACGRGGDCVEASWATGTAGELGSHAQRLTIDDREHSHNLAVSGAGRQDWLRKSGPLSWHGRTTSRSSSAPMTHACGTRRR